MALRVSSLPGALLLASLATVRPAPASAAEQILGHVHFETSCNPEAAAAFDRGMLYQHSFWYRASQRSFEEALKADPTCGIAYWGIALSLLTNPHGPVPLKNLPLGAAALAKGKETGAKTERERDYLAALPAMYDDFDKADHRTRVQNYLKATEALATKYPGDDEAQIEYALTLNVAASPSDKTYANQLKGAAILEKIWDRQPDHPGIAHYLIHLYDTPALAAHGLTAARRYAKVAPDAPHALHMPSHIFTRVGAWQDSIDSNIASARSAKADRESIDQLHAMDYEVYAYLQLAQDGKAKEVIDEMEKVTGAGDGFRAGFYAHAASPARYAVERGDWSGAAALEIQPTPFAYIDAMTWFAKGLGAARSGDTAGARAAVVRLEDAREQWRTKKDAYWLEQIDIQTRVVTAWARWAAGDKTGALKTMSDAADAEDKTEKSPVTPGPLAPARELYGAMLSQSGDAQGALTAFEATLVKEPNRLNAFLGAAGAALALGDQVKARQYYGAAAAQAPDPDTARTGVKEAHAFLGSAK